MDSKLAYQRTRKTWQNAIRRCYDRNADQYPYYGGRGIAVCERWRNSFEHFLADMGHRPAGLTLDRMDPDGNYEPGNCRWATRREQSRNRRSTIWVRHEGDDLTLKEYATALALPYKRLHKRVSAGMAPKAAASQLLREAEQGMASRVNVTVDGARMTLRECARRYSVPYSILHYYHRRLGLGIDEALAKASTSAARA